MNAKNDPPAVNAPWHAQEAARALEVIASSPAGLSPAEAAARLARHGPNRLRPPRRRGPFLRLALQFHNVLIYVLMGAAAVTAALGHWVDTGVIVGVVVINAIIGFVQEGKAERALEAIRSMLSLRAAVLREGRRLEIPAEELVPGDIVLLQSGDKVPADLRLLSLRNLRIEEAALTGEAQPVEKSITPVPAEAAIGDRFSMAYSGTLVTYGQGRGVVIATGDATEIGRISAMLQEVQELTTPLLRQMAGFGRWLTLAILVLAAFAFGFGVMVRDYGAGEMFLAAVGLAVAAIPEGLPAIMTIALAIGVQNMASRNAIIRRLPAVETLGSVTVICSDKTGTLTRNEMTVQSLVTAEHRLRVTGAGYAPHGGFTNSEGREVKRDELPALRDIARSGLLCNDAELRQDGDAWVIEGDPTEGALVTLAMKAGLDPELERAELPRTDLIPFESEHRFMATLHHDHAGNGFIYLKGAPERVLEMCNRQRRGGDDETIDLAHWHRVMDECAREGQRLLAVAFRVAPSEQRELRFSDVEGGFTLLGLMGISDPPREEAIAAVARCRAAGIRVKMITGDHAATALAIAAQVGIEAKRALTGPELEAMDDDRLRELAPQVDVFARASPEHKLRLVQALQAHGEVVAMTGDGVNDAPALKRADVGVAMGIKGTEAAKQSAEMVLADDNFASIAHAVEEGRTVYENLKKAIVYILPTSGGEAGVVLLAILLGMALPITPVQILWVNMVTAVTLSLSLAFERPEARVMARLPRDPREPLLSRFLVWRIVFVSALLLAATMGLFLWELERGLPLDAARTVAVNMLVMGEIFYLFNCRYLRAPVLSRDGLLGNPWVPRAVALVLGLQLLFTYAPPMQALFGTTAIDLAAWWRITAAGAVLLLVVEAEKRLLNHGSRHP